MFDYDQASCKAASALDNYDLTEVLLECRNSGYRDPWDIQEKGIIVNFPELETVLDDLSLDEFMDYLRNRYTVRFDEVISYRMTGIPERRKR